MTNYLPKELVTAVSEGRAVLFLGAGASREARDGKGNEIPDAGKLAAEIVDKFLGKDYEGLDFRSAYDLACSVRDVLAVQRFLFDHLNAFSVRPRTY